MMMHLFLGVLLLGLAGALFVACGNHSKNKTIENASPQYYAWSPRPCTPHNFHIRTEWFYVKYGNDRAAGASSIFFRGGIGMDECCLDDGIYDTPPTGVDITWFSQMERKCYKAEIDFTEKEIAMIDALMKQGFEMAGDRREGDDQYDANHTWYRCFFVCCLPGGKLHFYLGTPYERVVELDFTYQAEETHELDESLCYGLRGMMHNDVKYWEDVNDFYDDYLYEGKHYKELDSIAEHLKDAIKYHREHGVPYDLWNDYFTRYDYHIEFEWEEEPLAIISDRWWFANGEMSQRFRSANPQNMISKPTPPTDLYTWFKASDFYGHFRVFFDEEETFRIFKQAYSEHPNTSGVLKIVVVENGKRAEARLQMGDASYRFEKAMIELEDHDKRGRIFSNFEYDEEGAIPNHFWFTGN